MYQRFFVALVARARIRRAVVIGDTDPKTTLCMSADAFRFASSCCACHTTAASATGSAAVIALAAAQAAHGKRQQVLDAFTDAQRVAREAFERAKRLAKDNGVEVKLKSDGARLNVTVSTSADGGKSESRELHEEADEVRELRELMFGGQVSARR